MSCTKVVHEIILKLYQSLSAFKRKFTSCISKSFKLVLAFSFILRMNKFSNFLQKCIFDQKSTLSAISQKLCSHTLPPPSPPPPLPRFTRKKRKLFLEILIFKTEKKVICNCGPSTRVSAMANFRGTRTLKHV